MKKGKRGFASTIFLAMFLMVAHIVGLSAILAGAQEVKKVSKEQTRQSVDLGAITVTAQKQEENIQEVPVSVSVLTGQGLEDRNIDGLWKMADFIPNLMILDVGM